MMRNEHNLPVRFINAVEQLQQPRLNLRQRNEVVRLIDEQQAVFANRAVQQNVKRNQHALALRKIVKGQLHLLTARTGECSLEHPHIETRLLGIKGLETGKYFPKIPYRIKNCVAAVE